MKGFILRKTVLKPHAWAPNQKNKSTHGNHIKTKIQTTYCFRDSLKNRTNLNQDRSGFPSNLRSSQSVPRSIKSYKTFGRAALHSAEGIWRRLEPLQYATASLKSLESAKRSVSNDNSWNSSRTVFSDTLEMGIKKEFGNSYWILFSCSLTRNEANNTKNRILFFGCMNVLNQTVAINETCNWR